MFGFGGPTLFPRHVAKRDERVATNRIEVEPAGFLDDVFELLAGFAELPQSDVSSCSSQAQPERSRVIILGYERECARVEAVCLAQPFTVLGLFASLAQRLDRAGNGRRHLRPADLTGDQACLLEVEGQDLDELLAPVRQLTDPVREADMEPNAPTLREPPVRDVADDDVFELPLALSDNGRGAVLVHDGAVGERLEQIVRRHSP